MTLIQRLKEYRKRQKLDFIDKLCIEYNNGDLCAFELLMRTNACNHKQKQELTWLLKKNYELCCDPGYLPNEQEYHDRKRSFISEFGVTFIQGDAFPAYKVGNVSQEGNEYEA